MVTATTMDHRCGFIRAGGGGERTAAAMVVARVTLPGVPLAAVVPAAPPAAHSRRPGRDLRGGSGLHGRSGARGYPYPPQSPDPPQSDAAPPHHGHRRCFPVTREPRASGGGCPAAPCRCHLAIPAPVASAPVASAPVASGSRLGTGSSSKKAAPMDHRRSQMSIPNKGVFPAWRQFRMWPATALLLGDPTVHARKAYRLGLGLGLGLGTGSGSGSGSAQARARHRLGRRVERG